MRSLLILLALSVAALTGASAHADTKSGGTTIIKGADCQRQQVTTCHAEFQLDGKGGTKQTWVCTTAPGACVMARTNPSAGTGPTGPKQSIGTLPLQRQSMGTLASQRQSIGRLPLLHR